MKWFNPVVFFIAQCLSAAVVIFSLALRKVDVYKALCNLSLRVLAFPTCILSISFNVWLVLSTKTSPVELWGMPVTCCIMYYNIQNTVSFC